MFSVRLRLPTERLKRMADSAKSRDAALRAVGVYVTEVWMPYLFKSKGLGTWPARKMRDPGGQPLVNHGQLADGFQFAIKSATDKTGDFVRITNTGKPPAIVWALNFGKTITPKTKKFLTLPVVGPGALSQSQAERSKARDFPGAFALMKGPEGPGIYRKAGRTSSNLVKRKRGTGYKRSGGGKTVEKSIVRIFAFAKSVTIPPRPFFKWFPQMKAEALRVAAAKLKEQIRGVA